jgi:hypothetical protein
MIRKELEKRIRKKERRIKKNRNKKNIKVL